MDNVRWTMNPPIPDDSIEYFQKTRTGIGAALMPSFQVFGSPHPTGCQFVLLDGSVHTFGYDADINVFHLLGNRLDGQSVNQSAL